MGKEFNLPKITTRWFVRLGDVLCVPMPEIKVSKTRENSGNLESHGALCEELGAPGYFCDQKYVS